MKLFIKILLFVFATLITKVKVVSATITFTDIPETTTSSLSHTEMPKSVFKVIENDLIKCCKKGNDLVAYRAWGTGVEADAAKTGHSFGHQQVR
jgi:hypothetical protein